MQLHSGLQYVCMQINTCILTASVSFAFISTGHICTARHACTQIHIYQPFSLCVLLFCGGWKSNFLPKDDSRGPSPPGCSGGTDGSLCAVQMQRFAATDVTWCWAADGASGERVDVWQSTFKLEPPRKILALLSETERDESHLETFNWRWQMKVGYLWFSSKKKKQSTHPDFSIYAVRFSALSCFV